MSTIGKRLLLALLLLTLSVGGAFAQQTSVRPGGGGGAGGSVMITDGVDTLLIDGSGRVTMVCSNCSGSGASLVDDVLFQIAVDSIAPAGYLADMTTPDSVNEGDVGLARMGLDRVILQKIWDAAGNERGANVSPGNELRVAGSGTAGTADADVLTVQGIASMTPLLIQGTGTAGSSGTAVLTVQGIGGGTALPVSVAANLNVIGTLTNNTSAHGANRLGVLPGITEVTAPTRTDGRDAALSLTAGGAARVMVTDAAGSPAALATDATHDSAASATGPQAMFAASAFGSLATAVSADDEAVRAAADRQGVLYVRNPTDPCDGGSVTQLPVSANADGVLIAAGGASNRTYICGGVLVAHAAEILNIWEGTGTACGTSSAALAGSTTEANGIPMDANGGFIIPSTIRGIGTNVDVCIRLNATNRVSGWITYAQAP